MWSQGLNICTSSSSMWRGIRWIVTAFPKKKKKIVTATENATPFGFVA